MRHNVLAAAMAFAFLVVSGICVWTVIEAMRLVLVFVMYAMAVGQ